MGNNWPCVPYRLNKINPAEKIQASSLPEENKKKVGGLGVFWMKHFRTCARKRIPGRTKLPHPCRDESPDTAWWAAQKNGY